MVLTRYRHDDNGTITETLIGGVPSKQGTWAIEEVAIEFAGWCSVQFKIWRAFFFNLPYKFFLCVI